MTVRPPVPVAQEFRIHPGPALLAGIELGPTLTAHREQYGRLRKHDVAGLLDLVEQAGLRGRGGAAFPFATKLETAARRRRPVVVVNLSEGETASSKDAALAQARPHLVLDGAIAAATALGARDVHVVLPADRPLALRRMQLAMGLREDRVKLHEHVAEPRFVSGQSSAVIELIAGRPNLPVTTWAPAAVAGLDGRPTLLCNAETFARVGLLVLAGAAAYRRLGTATEPGTTLVTVTVPGHEPEVREVEFGSPLRDVLPAAAYGGPAVVGGFHGSWARWQTLVDARVSVPGMAELGMPLGAGVVLPVGPGACPLDFTSHVVDYLAEQGARRCGPCLNGLPELALAVRRVRDGAVGPDRAAQLATLLEGRGACAHPDGTARLVHSLFAALPEEVAAHGAGRCAFGYREMAS